MGLQVSLKDGKIQEVKILKDSFAHCKTIDKAFVLLQPKIISNQSLDVDAVTGATVSSNSIKYAIFKALKKAETR